jgi:hypothetical protein
LMINDFHSARYIYHKEGSIAEWLSKGTNTS